VPEPRQRSASNAKPNVKPNAKPNVKPKARSTGKARSPRTGGKRPRAAVRTALFLVVLVGLLFAFVYPTRTFLDQRKQTGTARSQLALLRDQNAKLTKEATELNRDAVIEQIAREHYGLVKPGETPFVILPTPTSSTVPPAPSSTGSPP
jgi:cell division protein FtsB